MKIFIVYAHPEPRSLSGSLKDHTVSMLQQQGHDVRVSDLYAMKFKTAVDAEDFPFDTNAEDPLNVVFSSKSAYAEERLTPDVRAEQEKMLWADATLFIFPMWWFSMPAILKGWIDRVYAYGFAYGRGEYSDTKFGERYGEGNFTGKRAMLMVTAGGWSEHYSARGINGPIDDVLFPINHGMLFYPGFDVLPSFLVYNALSVDGARMAEIKSQLQIRLQNLFHDEPIAYRVQNGGDYEIPSLTLKPDIETQGHGYRMHLAK